MQLNAFVLLATMASAFAAPTELTDRNTAVDGHLLVCTDNNFAGQCSSIGFFSGQCSNMPSGFQDNISSFVPDDGWECTTFTNNGCSGATYTGHSPGFGSLPSGINDKISSFRCYRI